MISDNFCCSAFDVENHAVLNHDCAISAHRTHIGKAIDGAVSTLCRLEAVSFPLGGIPLASAQKQAM